MQVNSAFKGELDRNADVNWIVGGHSGFAVQKSGDGRVALIGFPSVGKSSLLNAVTDTKSEAAAYEFTTLTCIPGNLVINDTKIQMLDLPGIIEGAHFSPLNARFNFVSSFQEHPVERAVAEK